MTIEEIIYAFTHVENLKFPKEALDSAIEIQEEITPVLLDYIQLSPPELLSIYEEAEIEDKYSNMMWDFSMHLLGQFRCKEAFDPIIKFFTYTDPSLMDGAAGDLITETLPSVLDSTFNGDVEKLFAVMKQENIDHYVKGAFLRSSLILRQYDELDKQNAYLRYHDLLQYYIKHDEEMVTVWVSDIADLADSEFTKEIEDAFTNNLVDKTYITPQDVQHIYNNPPEQGSKYYSKIDDTYALMKGWAWFVERASDWQTPSIPFENYNNDLMHNIVETARRESPKIGRNEPCPCGSGKKYKKCCLQ